MGALRESGWCWPNGGAPRPTVTQAEAVESALCFGWIDGQVGALDALIFRLGDARRSETRARRISQFVEMLAAAQTFH